MRARRSGAAPRHVLLLLLIGAGCAPAAEPGEGQLSPASGAGPLSPPAIPFQRFVLANGLTLIVHEDRREPVAQVRMFYHVGERDAGPGETGYPHLFEHLAFSRSEHLDRSMWDFLAAIGARNYDATTRYDYTHYFATVPVEMLDSVLWLEAQRMGHLASALTEEDLRRSRGEVMREAERLLRLEPIRVLDATWDHSYPEEHPYAGFDIASEDLDHATLAEARRFYARYYNPTNAVLVIAGDVDAEAVRGSVEARFGDIPAGLPRDESDADIGRRIGSETRRIEGLLRAPQLRVVWNTPGWGTAAADHLGLGSLVVASRVRVALLDRGLATSVEAATDMRELGGQVMLDVTAASDTVFRAVERIIRDEIARLAEEGPGAVELDRAKTLYRTRLAEDLQGLAGRTYLLGKAELFRGDPGHVDVMRRRADAATSEDVRRAVNEWLTDGAFVLEFTP